MTPIALLLLAALAALLLAAAATDVRARTIANPLNAAIALLALPWWVAIGLSPWGIAAQLLLAAAVLALFALFFALGAMGGGDVKLLAALALWLPFTRMVALIEWTAIGGGLLTLAMLARHRLRRAEGRPEIPYGVAIAGAALLILTNDILTNTAA